MANAKKCDICGRYYDVPDNGGEILLEDGRNTSMIRVLRRKPIDYRIEHEIMQFDSCEDCLQDVLDYMLTKKADNTVEKE